MSMNTFLWWSGAGFWVLAAALGIFTALLLTAEFVVDYVIKRCWSVKECYAFVWDRLKKRGKQ